jgi:glycosyltransferase involved in cell wall biosynthesis
MEKGLENEKEKVMMKLRYFILCSITMKILFILDLFKPHVGGVEVLFDNLIKGVLEQGHSVKVLTSKYTPELLPYEKISDTYEIYRVGHNRYDFMFFCLFKGITLAKWADIVHTTTYNSAIPASIIGKLSKRKVVLTVHEIFGQLRYRFMGRKGFFYKCFERLIFLFPFAKFLCVSNYTKNNLRIHLGISDQKLITIYNGIDYLQRNRKNFPAEAQNAIRKENGLEKNYVGLFFGRPGISKGLLYYVQALPLILKKIPQFKALLIVSESNNNKADDVKAFIHKHHLSAHIIWIPGVKYNMLGNYILASDVVIVPSLVEGFGFSATETCALGQQLVVTNVASLTEVVSGKVNFVEPANAGAIAEKVIDFYQGKFESISEKRFEWSENVEKTVRVYENLLHFT